MVLPSPATVLSPANLYEELQNLKTKYRKFIVILRSVTVKLSLWTPCEHMGGVDVWLHTLTLALERYVWSASRPTRRTFPLPVANV